VIGREAGGKTAAELYSATARCKHLEIDVSIGLDLLVSCRLVLDGPARLSTLEY
jgi:hypothetical protein